MLNTMTDTVFSKKVRSVRPEPLNALEITTLQVNVGYQCNLACKHCHVEAGPARTEIMDKNTIDAVLRALSASSIRILDITGGAPEMNAHFRYLVKEARNIDRNVIVRTNLAIFYEEGMEDLPEFYEDHDVNLVASLPYYIEDNVDRVRGSGTFKKSIAALQKLNRLGYGNESGRKELNLVFNPQGAFLPPSQSTLEEDFKKELKWRFGISFNHLFAFTNMPVGRFKDFLVRTGSLEKYMALLSCVFNPRTLDTIMCRHLISVGWDGTLFDCDFNQALRLPLDISVPRHIEDFDQASLATRLIEVGDHCFGCTAGQGST